ncbi:Aste57867_5631 [Aphanomyces stellatus]|uniref:Aste57867_5631 protein n=1 Tax=Aphanomyces stellatus TaxID=120398 RepID=A0A485KER9_9STRA|nr:hypothetical protein As57867_005618 [Aphanomyces stellatus]VFT82677.1 Aste57867_5631 [Aphanomyces stellatus]
MKAPPPADKKKEATATKDKKDGPKAPKPALSHKTLAMKFMQRKNQAALAQEQVQDEWPDHDDGDTGGEGGLSVSRDIPDASMDKKLGRRSFGGFNGNVEEVQKALTSTKRFDEANEKALKDEVSAEEMADRMSKYTGLRKGISRQPSNRPPKRQKK